MRVEAPSNEVQVYVHTAYRIIPVSDLRPMQEAGTISGVIIGIVATAGEKFTPMPSITQMTTELTGTEDTVRSVAPEVTEEQEVLPGEIYVSLVKYNLRAGAFGLESFDKEVAYQKEQAQDKKS